MAQWARCRPRTAKPIAKIKEGDEVLATNPESDRTAARRVTATVVHLDAVIDFQLASGTIATTTDHPFWNAAANAFQAAGDLRYGDVLLTPAGQDVVVLGLGSPSTRVRPAYNLDVTGDHTY